MRTRAEKVRRVGQEIPPTSINGPATGDLLVVGWGGTYGSITQAVDNLKAQGKSVSVNMLRDEAAEHLAVRKAAGGGDDGQGSLF
mgnify:CR=1 FL=1